MSSEYLNLEEDTYSDSAYQEYKQGDDLVEWIKTHKTQEYVHLDSKNLNNDQVKVIVNELKANKQWKYVNLSDNKILGGTSGQYLADALMVNEGLETLDLSKTSLLDEGLQLISRSLKMNTKTHLSELTLVGNGITDVGCQYISEMLMENIALHNLYLDNNLIGDAGLTSLAVAVKINNTNSNPGLSHVSIKNNKISDNSVNIIIDLFENSRLDQLILDGNEISAEGIKRLRLVFADKLYAENLISLSRNPPEAGGVQGGGYALGLKG
ncbi:unnamed protein product [Didymodactylos carnosus]|uniref:RNI-like protein n=1 Tax=Didymodactylos carnosus TaxID=1234261 RepID=A0A815JZY6_9BILA|nr:unnamed protein product [Didymodactylos carnosus]CAF1386191.1 unnamed protein product [Didymodactylos carnosus]CAF4054706.1 unnamed protein product [Didymodactylos carnosus]CAF4281202.1 unnamed protein product [Didymodactylos carnosus]